MDLPIYIQCSFGVNFIYVYMQHAGSSWCADPWAFWRFAGGGGVHWYGGELYCGETHGHSQSNSGPLSGARKARENSGYAMNIIHSILHMLLNTCIGFPPCLWVCLTYDKLKVGVGLDFLPPIKIGGV